MYSYDDRIRAVRLYLKLGKRIRVTLLQLGYPTKNSLKSWHREYEQCHDLAVGLCSFEAEIFGRAKESRRRSLLRAWPMRCDDSERVGISKPRDACNLDRAVSSRRNKVHPWQGGGVPKAQEVKRAAVIELCTREESARVIAHKTGVSRPTLYNWKTQLLGREVSASVGREKKSEPEHDRAELERQVESLRRDIRKLQLEHDILKKANELLKKGMGIDPQKLSNREKTMLVDALKDTYALREVLAALSLARSSYFYHRASLLIADKYAGERRIIVDIFDLNHRCYGYRRMRAALGRYQLLMSEKVVRRLMKQEGLVAATTRRQSYHSYRGEIGPAPENLIDRDFRAAAPNEKWLTDITEFQIPAGKVYLSPLIDCFDGLVVSWTIGTRPDAELVNTMLDAGIESVAGDHKRPVIHSDRGAHYRWPGWHLQDARREMCSLHVS